MALGGLVLLFDYKKKKKMAKNNKENKEMVRMKQTESKVIKALKDKIYENINSGLYIESLRRLTNNTFTVATDGRGVQVQQLGKFILKWEHFEEIVKKANALGGKMYRGDGLPQNSGTELEDISRNCMEGFIAKVLLGISDGKSITRRSTYYSGILAWAGIVTLHNSDGKGSYITVNADFRKV